MYNANRLKEFCEWFKRTNVMVKEMCLKSEIENQ